MAAVLLATVVGWVGYAITARALTRADQNVALSLEVFGELFDHLATDEPISTPPLGESGGLGVLEPQPEGRWPAGRVARPGRPCRRAGEIRKRIPTCSQSILTFYDQLRPSERDQSAARRRGRLGLSQGRSSLRPARSDADAEEAYARAIAIFEQLAARYPDVPEYRSKLVQTFDMAEPHSADASSLKRIEGWLRRARKVIDQLVDRAPDNAEYTWLRTRVYVKLGTTLTRLGQSDEAVACYQEAIAYLGTLIDRSPSNDALRLDRATAIEALAMIALERGRREEAQALLDGTVADMRILIMSARTPPLHRRLRSLATTFLKLDDKAQSQEITHWAELDEARPHPPPHGGRGRGVRDHRGGAISPEPGSAAIPTVPEFRRPSRIGDLPSR